MNRNHYAPRCTTCRTYLDPVTDTGSVVLVCRHGCTQPSEPRPAVVERLVELLADTFHRRTDQVAQTRWDLAPAWTTHAERAAAYDRVLPAVRAHVDRLHAAAEAEAFDEAAWIHAAGIDPGGDSAL